MNQLKEALYYEKLGGGRVQCALCPHRCVISEGKRGLCRARKNEGGKLYSLIHGRVTSVAMDPVEKKPLYHFHPGCQILSLGTTGCNFACPFCLNYTIAQSDCPTQPLSSQQAIDAALEHDSIGIAYTYNEPFIWFEYVLETAKLARESGLKNVLVSNGYVLQEPLKELLPFIDALNIDIKSIRPEFYAQLCRGRLEHVLETCKTASRAALVEITNLVIPGHNDTDAEFEQMARWLADNLGRQTPMHLSAYHPCHKMTAPPTPAATLERAFDIFAARLDYVYLGNLRSSKGSHTACKSCNTVLIERLGYHTRLAGLAPDGTCAKCGAGNNIVV